MTQRHSTALRVCLQCGAFLRVELWPWNGSVFVRTDGLCSGCLRRLSDAAREDDAAQPAAGLELPPSRAH